MRRGQRLARGSEPVGLVVDDHVTVARVGGINSAHAQHEVDAAVQVAVQGRGQDRVP